jgi:4-hydroxybenzoate polyprenyltransferase
MVKSIVKLIRPKQWIKNFFLFPALIFSKHLPDAVYVQNAMMAFVAFSLAASSVYVFNDIFDRDHDRQHPEKKSRPIASGVVSVPAAMVLAFVLLALGAAIAVQLNGWFQMVVSTYLLMNVLYSMRLKQVVILDVMIIAMGFVLRVAAGAVAINVEISSWIILCTLFLSVFLGTAKRQAELVGAIGHSETRAVLSDYSLPLLDKMLMVSAAATVLSYALYTASERTLAEFHTTSLIYTTVFVIYGVFRYLWLLDKKNLGENPTHVLLADWPTFLNMTLWILTTIIIIYRNSK